MGCRNSKASSIDEYVVTYAPKKGEQPPKQQEVAHKETEDLSVSIAPNNDDEPDQGDRFFDTNLVFANTVWKTAVETREVYDRDNEKVKQSQKKPQPVVEQAPAVVTQQIETARADSASSDDSEQVDEHAAQYRPDFFKTRLTTANFDWTGTPPQGSPEDLAAGVLHAKTATKSKIPNPFATGKISLASTTPPTTPPTTAPAAAAAPSQQLPTKQVPAVTAANVAVTTANVAVKARAPGNAQTTNLPEQRKHKSAIPTATAAPAAPQVATRMGPSMKQLRDGVPAPVSAMGKMGPSSIPKVQQPDVSHAPIVSPFAAYAAQSQRPFIQPMQQTTTVGGRSNPFANKDW